MRKCCTISTSSVSTNSVLVEAVSKNNFVVTFVYPSSDQPFPCLDPVALFEPFWVADDVEIAPRAPELSILLVLAYTLTVLQPRMTMICGASFTL